MIVLTWKFELYKVVAGLVSVLFLGSSDAATINAAKDVCLERGCVLAAADIINSLDEKTDPCTGKRRKWAGDAPGIDYWNLAKLGDSNKKEVPIDR